MFWAEIGKILHFYLKTFSYWCEIFDIFEKACFRNKLFRNKLLEAPVFIFILFYFFLFFFWEKNKKSKNKKQHLSGYPSYLELCEAWYNHIMKKTTLFKYTENFTTKTENFQIKIGYFSYFCSKHRLWVLVMRGGSNEYPQSMFLSRSKKNNIYPCKLQFYYINVGFKGVKII